MKVAITFATILFTAFRLCAATPVRIAIVADDAAQPVADLLTTQLTAEKDVSLVERADLSKIGDELKLQELAGKDSAALGKLVNADGLLIINKIPDGIHVRFTAVGLGYAMFDDQVVPGKDLEPLVTSIAHRVEECVPKLKLTPVEAIPISVLNLRADYATSDTTALERKLTLLLESRLAAVPACVVLERRHAWSLGFENSLETDPKPLLQGASVVDGIVSLKGNGDISVHLRLRSPSRQETSFETQGTISDLPGLVEQLVVQIQKATGITATSIPWDPKKEAHEYMLEGIWGWRHRTYDAAIEALDSAELLGEPAPDLLAVRILTLSEQAASPEIYQYNLEPLPDNPNPGKQIDAILRAMDDVTRYKKENLESKLTLLDPVYAGEGGADVLRLMVSRTACVVLAMLDRTNNPRAGELRTAIRSFMNYDPFNGKIPGDFSTAIEFADDLSTTMEEEQAYYRNLCMTYPWNTRTGLDLQWRINPIKFCTRFLPKSEERSAAYFKFLHELLKDPVSKPAGLLYLATHVDDPQKAEACRAFYDDLWDQRESLIQTRNINYFLNRAFALGTSRNARPPADPKLVELLRYYFQHDNTFSGIANIAWVPALIPSSEAPGLLDDLRAYEKRDPNAVSNKHYPQMEKNFTDRIGKQDVALVASATTADNAALVVSRRWYPHDGQKGAIFHIPRMVGMSDGIWLSGEMARNPSSSSTWNLYHINPDTMETVAIPNWKNASPDHMLITKEAVYLTCLTDDNPQKFLIKRYDFALGYWVDHEVSGVSGIYEVAGQLYISLRGGLFAGENEGGIARYNGRTGEIALLASSRRRPAQNQLDDRSPYNVENIFAGPEGKPCATINTGGMGVNSYYINENPGAWIPLIQVGFLIHGQTDGSRTLLYGPGSNKNNSDLAIMIDPAKSGPELWLGVPRLLQRPDTNDPKKMSQQDLPLWARTSIWPTPDKVPPNANSYGFRGDDLFCFGTPALNTKAYELIWYQRGKPQPVRIPLRFETDESTDNELKATLSDAEYHAIHKPDILISAVPMAVTSKGICFASSLNGFWYLPFTDIDAFLKTHPQGDPESTLPAASHMYIPSPRKKSSGGDEVDPNDPSSFP